MVISRCLLWALWIVCISTVSAIKKCDKRTNILMSDCDKECDVACIIHQKENRRLTGFGAGGLTDSVYFADKPTMRPEVRNRISSSTTRAQIAHLVESDTESGCQYLCKNPFQRDDWPKDSIHYKMFSIEDDSEDNTNVAEVVSAKNLDKIDLKLPKDLKSWKLDGGRIEHIRNVEISYDMFKNATNLIALFIENVDVSIDKLLQNLPKSIKSLSLIKCNISEVPATLSKFGALEYLDLSWNQISSFEANLPSLYRLNLGNNSLKSIPSSVVNLTSLRNLHLFSNPLDDRNVSNAVYQVLDRTIEGFGDFEDARGNCSNGTFKTVGNTKLSVCVAREDDASQSREVPPRASSSNDRHDTSVGDDSNTPSADTYEDEFDPGFSTQSANGTALSPEASDTTSLVPLYVVVPIVIVLAIAGAVMYRKYQQNKKTTDGPSPVDTPNDNGQSIPDNKYHQHDIAMSSIWSDSVLRTNELLPNRIQPIRQIGAGAFGEVWLVEYFDAQFASKRLIKSKANSDTIQNFINETKLAAKLEHPHILTFVGVAFTKKADFQALYEYMARGDLRSYLTNPRVDHDWSEVKIQIAIDIVDALVYMHSFSPAYMHRDLKSRNVLLSEDMTAKIGDFGTARALAPDRTLTTNGIGTVRWLAPEILREENNYDESSDIYSFGAILIELDTHMLPYADMIDSDVKQSKMLSLASNIANGRVKPCFSSSCPVPIRTLGLACLEMNPSKRPKAACIHYALRRILQSGMSVDPDTLEQSLGVSSVDTASTTN